MNSIPFLFIHGAGGTKSKWRSVRELIGDDNAVYVDLPGHGHDSAPPQESIEAYAAEISEKVQQDVIVVGHSMGGLVGIELAAINPHVRGLVLAASHFRLPVHPKILTKLDQGIFPDSLFYASYRKDAETELIEEERAEIGLVPTAIAFSDYDCCDRYRNGEKTLARLEIPVFALYGTEDRLLPPNAQDEIVSVNALVRTELIKNAAHYVMLEQPGKVVDALLDVRRIVQ